jgi:hypothetical protein
VPTRKKKHIEFLEATRRERALGTFDGDACVHTGILDDGLGISRNM